MFYFLSFPYLAHIDHSVFKQRIEDLLKDSQGVQKFLLTTGDLNDSIQQSLNLVVGGDGKLNEGDKCWTSSRSKVSKKCYAKPNQIDFVFRDIAKFDTHNLLIGNLLSQIQSQKLFGETPFTHG